MSIVNRKYHQPTISFEIEDEDAIIPTTYAVRVSYTKCKGYAASWGYNGGDPGEPNHVEDVTIEDVEEIHIADQKFTPTSPKILEAIRAKYGECKEIAEKCLKDAFDGPDGPDCDDIDE